MPAKRLFPDRTPVVVQPAGPGGKWYQGYYMGLARFDCCHRVTAGKSKTGPDWIICNSDCIKRDYSKRAKPVKDAPGDDGLGGIFK